jgi:hypothetical protein
MTIDPIYDIIDAYMRYGKFDTINDWLRVIPKCTTTNHLLAYLTATLPAKSKLPYRPEFLKMVESELRKRNEWTDGVLTGLA